MESRKQQRNRRKRQKLIWILWGLTIWLILLLILFGSDSIKNGRRLGKNSRPAVSDHIEKGEHIPGNMEESVAKTTPSVSPDEIQEEISGAPEPGDGNPEEITAVPEPGDGNPEEITAVPEPGDGNPGETTAVPEPGDGNPGEITMIPEPEEEEPEKIPVVPEDVTKRVVNPDKPMVALTFDDGPYRNNTKAILDVFEQYNGRATFFVVGYHLDVFAEDTVEAYRRGFQIGNHTLEHPELPKLSNKEALEQIRSLNRKLNKLGIPGDVMVRPPYGAYTDYLKENLNVPMIGWNVDSEDWRSRDVDKIYEQIVGKVKDGDIVLLHDLHDVTAEAMQRVVPALAEAGFQLVTVEELFAAKGVEPQAGQYYCYVR